MHQDGARITAGKLDIEQCPAVNLVHSQCSVLNLKQRQCKATQLLGRSGLLPSGVIHECSASSELCLQLRWALVRAGRHGGYAWLGSFSNVSESPKDRGSIQAASYSRASLPRITSRGNSPLASIACFAASTSEAKTTTARSFVAREQQT